MEIVVAAAIWIWLADGESLPLLPLLLHDMEIL